MDKTNSVKTKPTRSFIHVFFHSSDWMTNIFPNDNIAVCLCICMHVHAFLLVVWFLRVTKSLYGVYLTDESKRVSNYVNIPVHQSWLQDVFQPYLSLMWKPERSTEFFRLSCIYLTFYYYCLILKLLDNLKIVEFFKTKPINILESQTRVYLKVGLDALEIFSGDLRVWKNLISNLSRNTILKKAYVSV